MGRSKEARELRKRERISNFKRYGDLLPFYIPVVVFAFIF